MIPLLQASLSVAAIAIPAIVTGQEAGEMIRSRYNPGLHEYFISREIQAVEEDEREFRKKVLAAITFLTATFY